MSERQVQYMPALDGLRALAVGLVVAYHLGLPWAPGGFLGVDLFFVISGYLITSLLLREYSQNGRIAVGSFWMRRFKRLVPPLVVMIVATVGATRLWGIPEQWASIRSDSIAALGYVANWRFVAADQSYFDTLLGPSPLRHTWSLALEEQWYLVWPLAMTGLGWLTTRRRGRAWGLGILIGGAVLSGLLMIAFYTSADPSRVYYGTDTRAQQLLIGAALAWLTHQWHRRPLLTERFNPKTFSVVAHTALVVFIAVAFLVEDDAAWLYHGGLFALSAVAAVVVLATTLPGSLSPLSWLGWAPLVAVGRRSYGIYLWHWPVIVFVGEPTGLDITGVPLYVVQVAITALLSELSFRFVEAPTRHTVRSHAPVLAGWTAGAIAAAALAVVVLVPPAGRTLLASSGRHTSIDLSAAAPADGPTTTTTSTTTTTTTTPPSTVRPASTTAPLTTAPLTTLPAPGDVAPTLTPATAVPPTSTTTTTTTTTVAPEPTGPPHLLLMGDSTALQLVFAERDRELPEWEYDSYALLGCAITDGFPIDVDQTEPTSTDPACRSWRTDWPASIEIVQPDISVVMIGAWEVLDHLLDDGQRVSFPSPAWSDHVSAALTEAADIATANDTPAVFLTLPCMRQIANESFPAVARNDMARVEAFNTLMADVVAANPNASTLDLAGVLCPGGNYLEDIDGTPARYDGVHVTPAGANLVWDWLLDGLTEVLDSRAADGSIAN